MHTHERACKKQIHASIFPLIVHFYSFSFLFFYFIHNGAYVILLMDKVKCYRFFSVKQANDECLKKESCHIEF